MYKTSFGTAVFHYHNVRDEEEVGQDWRSNVSFNQDQSLENLMFIPMLGTLGSVVISFLGGGQARFKTTFNNSTGF